MARITITIEDAPDGSVMIIGSPSPQELTLKANTAPDAMSGAEGWALGVWTALMRTHSRATEAEDRPGGARLN
ncbi:MAG: hypothetical protein U1E83_01265 [Methylotetracoccus sp.]